MKYKQAGFAGAMLAAIAAVTFLSGWVHRPVPVAEQKILGAVGKSIPILQTSGHVFITKVHCASCHHSLLTSLVTELARKKGVPVEDSFAVARIGAMMGGMQFVGDPNKIGRFLNVPLIAPYTLMALAAEKVPPTTGTDLLVGFLLGEQNPDGSFPGEYARAPFEYGQFHVTVLSQRGIQLYGSPAMKSKTDQSLAKTKNWLENTKTGSWQELNYKLLGLHWCGSVDSFKRKIASQLIALQRPDGGWAQSAGMQPDAFATGLTLYVLQESGMLHAEDAIAQRAIEFLLRTQDPSGAWIVEARSFLIQPFVNSGFPPYDENQFSSAAATNWATLALLQSLPDKPAVAFSR